jgi:hypothetical protein
MGVGRAMCCRSRQKIGYGPIWPGTYCALPLKRHVENDDQGNQHRKRGRWQQCTQPMGQHRRDRRDEQDRDQGHLVRQRVNPVWHQAILAWFSVSVEAGTRPSRGVVTRSVRCVHGAGRRRTESLFARRRPPTWRANRSTQASPSIRRQGAENSTRLWAWRSTGTIVRRFVPLADAGFGE